MRALECLKSAIPGIKWIVAYKKSYLAGDLTAGALVGVMLVPQGMAYAMLAGLPPVMGLYASVLPLVIYALFGSSRQLAVGPVAMVSLLTITSVGALARPGSSEYVALVLQLALMVGVIQLVLGFVRMGMMVNFMSHAVISGFTSAAAVIIILSQLKHVLGIKIPSAETATELCVAIYRSVGDLKPTTAAVGLISIVLILAVKKLWPRVPAALLIVILGTVVVRLLHLERYGVNTVGVVPSGLPALAIPAIDSKSVVALLPAALTVTFVGYMESIAIAKGIASRERYRIYPNSELIALGLANVAGGLSGAYPVTGSFSRSAVNYQTGAKTGMASLATAAVVVLGLVFLTPLFYFLPNAVLSAVVVTAVFRLVDFDEARRLFRLRTSDGWVLVITFVTTLAVGAENGIIAGILLSLIVFVWRSARPPIVELGHVDSEKGFHDVARFPGAQTCDRALVLRIDESLYFANMSFVDDRLREYVLNRPCLEYVVIDFSGVNSIDAVSVVDLLRIMKLYEEKGIRFVLADVKAPVRDMLTKALDKKDVLPYVEGEDLQHALLRLGVMDESGIGLRNEQTA